jgi:16S rRNA (cytosine1402-N4)-methyltransferase
MAGLSSGEQLPHDPVLYQEIILALKPHQAGCYVDCTLGAAGHAWGILEASSPNGLLLGMDVDPQALIIARERLAGFGKRAIILQSSYTRLSEQLQEIGWEGVDGVLLDLGASSMQFDTPERGFSFQSEAPLNMRFDPRNPVSAGDLVNHLTEQALADLIFRYGEERKSRQIARAIVKARPVKTTRQLADIIIRANPARSQGHHLHPATRTFQALRIAVNQELEAVVTVLPQAVSALKSGGRLAVISFHSLEDRIVKQYFRQEAKDCICPPRQPICTCGHRASILEIHRSPIRPQESEIQKNPRARSALLRVVEKK